MTHEILPGGQQCDSTVNILRLDRSVLVVLAGEFDVFDADGLETACGLVLALTGPVVLVDVTAVGFLDCGFLGVIDDLARECERRGGWLSIVGASAPVRRVCQLMGLGLLLDASGPRDVTPIEIPPAT